MLRRERWLLGTGFQAEAVSERVLVGTSLLHAGEVAVAGSYYREVPLEEVLGRHTGRKGHRADAGNGDFHPGSCPGTRSSARDTSAEAAQRP